MKWFERIRTDREKLGLSQAELAKASGVSQALINRIERGEIRRTRSIFDIVRVLGIDIEALGDLSPTDALGKLPIRSPRAGGQETISIFMSSTWGDGAMRVVKNPVSSMEMLPDLIPGHDVWGVYASDYIMQPEFEAGDILILQSGLPILLHNTYLFRHVDDEAPSRDNPEPAWRCKLRRVVEIVPTGWLVKVWKPSGNVQDEHLSADEWPNPHRVVVRYYRK